VLAGYFCGSLLLRNCSWKHGKVFEKDGDCRKDSLGQCGQRIVLQVRQAQHKLGQFRQVWVIRRRGLLGAAEETERSCFRAFCIHCTPKVIRGIFQIVWRGKGTSFTLLLMTTSLALITSTFK
jgi:hypothetical protein